jgi:hypothetical protein
VSEPKKSPYCWWCSSKLVGPGGVRGREPLFFKELTHEKLVSPVRVHKTCYENAMDFLTDSVDPMER